MRILVTGGAGFIGSHLGDRLLEDGHEVIAFDNLDPQVHPAAKRPEYLSSGIELVVGDVRDRDAVARAIAPVDAVYHLAAAVGVAQSMYEIERYTSINTMGAAAVLQAVVETRQDLQKLVVASSMSIYGEGLYRCVQHGEVAPSLRSEEQLSHRDWEPTCPVCGNVVEPMPTREDKPLLPTSIYAINKRDHEEMFLATGAAYGLPTVALRFFNVYGPRQALSNPYTGAAAIFASRLLNGRSPVIFEDGEQLRDFTHVQDVVTACVRVLETNAADNASINVGRGRPVSVRTIAELLAVALGSDIEPEVLGKFRAGDIRHCYADMTKAHETIGFTDEVDLEDGLIELAQWLATQTPVDLVDEATAALHARGLAR
jgi:dTDP-L-rhamnose 4-epimerase